MKCLFEACRGVVECVGEIVHGLVHTRLHVLPSVVAGVLHLAELFLRRIALLAKRIDLVLVLDLCIGFGLVRLGLKLVDVCVPLIKPRFYFVDVGLSLRNNLYSSLKTDSILSRLSVPS